MRACVSGETAEVWRKTAAKNVKWRKKMTVAAMRKEVERFGFFFGEREIVSLVYNIREERMEGECDDIVLCEFSLFPQERKMFSYLCRQWIIMSKGIISYMHRVFLVDVLHVLV